MSEVNRDKVFDRAIDLVINQDHVAQQWTGRYIAVETSLAVAAAALLSWKGVGLVALVLALLLGAMAIVLALALTDIIKREYEWQKRYVEMVRRTEGDSPLLYQPPEQYEPLPDRDIPGAFVRIRPWIIAAWCVLVLIIGFAVFLGAA